MQTEFCPAGKHAIGFGNALGNQVIDQHTQVSLVSRWQPSTAHVIGLTQKTAALKRRIDASKQSLRCRLFITGGAVNLASKEQAANLARFKTALQRARVKVVVFNGVTWAENVRVLQALHRAHKGVLNVEGQAGRNAIGIELAGGQALGLQENLMAVFVGKAIDLVFNARAIARAHTFNFAGEHRAAVKARTNNVMGSLIGMRHPARHLRRMHVCPAHEAKNGDARLRVQTTGHAVPGLFLALCKVDGASIETRWRSCFQAPLRQLELFQTRRQTDSRRIACAASRIVFQAHMNLAIQKCAGR